jgi:hypothetical protein
MASRANRWWCRLGSGTKSVDTPKRPGESQFQAVLNRVFAIRKPNAFALWTDVLEALRAEVIN